VAIGKCFVSFEYTYIIFLLSLFIIYLTLYDLVNGVFIYYGNAHDLGQLLRVVRLEFYLFIQWFIGVMNSKSIIIIFFYAINSLSILLIHVSLFLSVNIYFKHGVRRINIDRYTTFDIFLFKLWGVLCFNLLFQ